MVCLSLSPFYLSRRHVFSCCFFLSVDTVLKSGLSDNHGSNYSVTTGYFTSDGTLAGAVKFEDFAVVVCDAIRPINNSRLIRKWMDSHFPNGVLEVFIVTLE